MSADGHQSGAGKASITRRILGIVAAFGVGLVTVVVWLAVSAASFVPGLPTVGSVTPRAQTVTPIAASSTLVCPGPALGSGGSDSATALSQIGHESFTIAATKGVQTTETRLKAPDVDAGDGPAVFTAPALSGASTPPEMSASQSQALATDQVRGFTAAACTTPSSDSWLAAGATSLGQTSEILLGNPGGVAANVNLAIYSESGAVSAPGASNILVQPKSQKVLSLAGLAPNVQAPVIHLTSTGAAVSAAVEQSTVSGITTEGADIAGPTAAPSERQIIPGVVISATPGTFPAGDDQSSSSAVRVFAPGTGTVSVTVSLRGEQSPSKPGPNGTAITANIPAGQVQEIPLPGAPAGSYTVTVAANVPLVASARSSTGGSGGNDYAWFSAGSSLGKTPLQIAVATGTAANVNLSNQSNSTVTVQLDGRANKIAAGASLMLPVSAGGHNLSAGEDIYASISFSGPSQLASYLVAPPGVGSSAVTVYAN